jgi:diadenosine tetraphosphatase ApaH/serine/threonine PP2A family protein phosphatase
MRYGLFGDVHSNIEALDAVLRALEQERCDQVVCLGDIIGYGANPKECLDRIRSLGIITVAGNHDLAAVGGFDLNSFNSAARDAILYSISKLSADDLAFLGQLPLVRDTNDFTIVHASPRKPENFDYIFTVTHAEEVFTEVPYNLTFIGHSHIPLVFFQDPGMTDYSFATEFYLRRQRRIIFNCGSVGQPRDGDPDACYVIFDTSIAKIRLSRVSYNVEAAANKILNADLPPILAERLYKGY